MKKKKIVFHDRYSALGIARPKQSTMCRGHCEGTGIVPVKMGNRGGVRIRQKLDPKLAAAWRAADKRKRSDDGWHFVKCPDCNGTGKCK